MFGGRIPAHLASLVHVPIHSMYKAKRPPEVCMTTTRMGFGMQPSVTNKNDEIVSVVATSVELGFPGMNLPRKIVKQKSDTC